MLLAPTLVACVAFTPGVVAAAGSDSTEGKASPDAVAAGLQKIQDMAAGSARAAGADAAKAEQLQGGIEPVWETIESTVKANDSTAYVALEDNFTLLKIAAKGSDSTKASTAAESVSAAAKDYLAKHPGNAGALSRSRSAAAADPSAETASPDNLPRTGPGHLGALGGLALCLGGLGVVGGARRRMSSPR
jgi:hypothetical protein